MNLGKIEYKWIVTAVAFVTITMASGVRNSFGVFFTPMQTDFGTGRASLALTASIGALVGALCQPLVGKLADSFGAKVVLVAGSAITGVGLVALGFTQTLFSVYLVFGLVLGVGYSAAGMIPNTSLVTRWFTERRGLALSLAISGFAVGQIILMPISAQLIGAVGWRLTYAILGLVFILVVLPLILLLTRDAPVHVDTTESGTGRGEVPVPEVFTPIRQAIRTVSFWKLSGSFTVCGFTAGLIYTHLVPYALDVGMSAVAAANLFSLIGLAGIGGSVGLAHLSDRIGRKNPLASLYMMRGITLLLLAMVGGTVAFPIVALILGLSRGTGPLTSAITGDLYGRLSVGTIFGLVFLSHEMAHAAGAYLGGLTFDLTSSYSLIFLVGAAMGVLGSIAAFSIDEARSRPAEAVPAVSPGP